MKDIGRTVAVAILVAVSLVSCRGAFDDEPQNVQVTIALGDSALEVVDTREVGELTNPHVEDSAVHFVFRPSDGSASIEGQIADTRVLRSEFDDDGRPDPKLVTAGTGLFSVRIPAVAGELELWSAAGESLGRVAIDPNPSMTRRGMLRQSDIIGSPVKVVDHGPKSNKVDILFVSEGYRESDLGRFRQHVSTIVSAVSRNDGYRPYWNRINVWRQDVRSRSRGTGSNGQAKDTAFETAAGISGVDRCVFFANSRGQRAARNIGTRVDADVVVVLVNRTTTGACAQSGMIVTSRPPHVAESVAHEIGHALFGLADEYDTPRANGLCITGPNVARSVSRLPWSDMLTTSTLPTPTSASRGTIGAFEGAGYCENGRYRPTHDCLMRTLGKELCAVCRREVARTMSAYAPGSSGVAGSTSSNSSIAAPGSLSPNGVVVSDPEVRLEWGRVTGAATYSVAVQRSSSGGWHTFGNVETSGTSARVVVREQGGQYRFTVRACSSSGCSAEASAQFAYATSSSGSSTSSSGSSSSSSGSAAPAKPTNLEPPTSSVVSDATPLLSWGEVSNATHYQFKMLSHDGTAWQRYVSEQPVTARRVRTTLREPQRWYAFAVKACNSGGCSEWSDFSTLYLRP